MEKRSRTIAKLHQKLNPGGDFYDTNLPFVNLLVAVALFGFVLWKMPSDNTRTIEQMSSDLSKIKDKMAPNNTMSVSTPKQK